MNLVQMARGVAILAQALVMGGWGSKSTGELLWNKLGSRYLDFTEILYAECNLYYSRNRRASEGDNWTEVGGGNRAGKRGGGSRLVLNNKS